MKNSNGWNTSEYGVWYISNMSAREKLSFYSCTTDRGSGAGTAPSRSMTANKWTNTSSVINAINFQQGGGSGDFAAGSECVVLGWDPADDHTTNFWEELTTKEIDSTGDNFDTSTFTSKKYLWVQYYISGTSSLRGRVFLGNSSIDTGSNYAIRRSPDGGADQTFTSGSYGIANADGGTATTAEFVNCFIVNVSSREKFALWEEIRQNTAGASNAPARNSGVGKWSNTSNQIDIVSVRNDGSGDIDSGYIKVWGSD